MQNSRTIELFTRYPQLEVCRNAIGDVFAILCKTFAGKGKLLIAGNGGSASDADHIAGELLKAFKGPHALTDPSLPQDLALHLQHALPVIPLPNLSGILTAYSNDCEPDWAFAQLVWGLGQTGDCFLALSTSGNSKNILNAAKVARVKGMSVIGLTGQNGGTLKSLCDCCICVPEEETFKIQELHLPIYHNLCLGLEEHFWGKKPENA